MKKLAFALVLAAGVVAGAAQAADLPSRKEPIAALPPPPVFTWTGLYAGLNIGAGWTERRDNGWNGGYSWRNGSDNIGVVGGGQIGLNYQLTPLFVLGVETDFQGTSLGASNDNNWGGVSGGGWNAGPRIQWFGTVRGRGGLTLADQRLLVYATGGFAYGDVRSGFGNWNGWSNWNNQVSTGWTVGGGAEYAFGGAWSNWSGKVEYLYTELSRDWSNNNNWGWNTGAGGRARFHTVRAGLNYRLNFGAASSVLARY